MDYKQYTTTIFNELIKHQALFGDLERTVENSPWHREANTLVHTKMVFEQYCNLTPDVWSRLDMIGALAALFHDIGKPMSQVEKFSAERGNYHAYNGHELASARLFEDFAVQHLRFLTADEIFTISWMIEYHLPWGITRSEKRDWLAKTAKKLGESQYTRVLLSDQRGRISDDACTKLSNVNDWIDSFVNLVSTSATDSNNSSDRMMIIPIAASGSGKSTYLTKLRNERHVSVFSLDDLRTQWYDAHDYARAFAMSTEDKSFVVNANACFLRQAKTDTCMYVDNTNLTKKRRRFYIDAAKRLGFKTVAVVMPTAITTIVDRQTTRTDKSVPGEVVTQQYMKLQLPSYGEFDDIIVSSHNIN